MKYRGIGSKLRRNRSKDNKGYTKVEICNFHTKESGYIIVRYSVKNTDNKKDDEPLKQTTSPCLKNRVIDRKLKR